jgi:hypothetical protein
MILASPAGGTPDVIVGSVGPEQKVVLMSPGVVAHFGIRTTLRDEPRADARRNLADGSRFHIVETYAVELLDVRLFRDSYFHNYSLCPAGIHESLIG